MDINKLTQKSREAVQDAQALTIEYGNTQIEQAHLLYALLAQENGLIPQMLTKMEIDPEAVKADAQQAVSRLPKVSGPGREPDKVYISQDVDRALNAAQNQADHMTDEYISVEHLMLGLMETADTNLKTIFKSVTGMGVMEYYRGLKIDAAKTLLREGGGNITQIADKLGYTSVNYFSRYFKQATGMTPSEYTQSIQAK